MGKARINPIFKNSWKSHAKAIYSHKKSWNKWTSKDSSESKRLWYKSCNNIGLNESNNERSTRENQSYGKHYVEAVFRL